MSDLNQCNFIGRVGRSPERREFDDGSAIVNISIAVSETWKDKGSGEKKERTAWVPIVFRGGLAEVVDKYVTKGSRIFVSGALRTRTYEKDGTTRYATEIIANQLQMLDSKPSTGEPAHERPPEKATPAPAQTDSAPFDDDDIPF